MLEQKNWLDYKVDFIREEVPTPKQFQGHRKDMKRIDEAVRKQKEEDKLMMRTEIKESDFRQKVSEEVHAPVITSIMPKAGKKW
jgi:hypothetical protein